MSVQVLCREESWITFKWSGDLYMLRCDPVLSLARFDRKTNVWQRVPVVSEPYLALIEHG